MNTLVLHLEDWATCTKSLCDRCGFDVRAEYFLDHLWIVHGIQAPETALVHA